jgi:hypothetical protein
MLKDKLSRYFSSMQRSLFPGFREELGPTTDKHLKVIVALDMIQVEKFTAYKNPFAVGRALSIVMRWQGHLSLKVYSIFHRRSH